MDPPLNRDLTSLFDESVVRHAGAPAVVTDDRALSFHEVRSQSARVAASLAEAGIRPGDRVGLYAVNSPAFPLVYMGIVAAGATVVPVNVLLGKAEIGFMLRDAGVRGLFHSGVLAAAADGCTEGLGELAFKVQIDGPDDGRRQHLDRWLAEAGEPPAVKISPRDDLAAIIYTSGTTGRPKGAMLTHSNLAANTWSTARALGLRPRVDRTLVVLPLFHSFAATVGMLTSLLHGASFVPLPRFEPDQVADAIVRHRVTVFLGVPSMCNALLRLPEAATPKLGSLRVCVSGGAAMPVELMRRFEDRFGIGIHEGDGPTECSPVTCINPLEGRRKPGTVGLPVPLVEMRIADRAGRELPDGEVGEICVRGPSVMKGYWNLPDATAESFFGDWFRTGDLGQRDGDGYFSILDRLKDVIIVNGMNVYPRMVEEVLYTHPGVREAAVVGQPHEAHGEIPVAYVATVARGGLEPGALRKFCRERLGTHQVPRRFVFLDELPKNATGKILKRELRRQGEVERGVNSAPGFET